MNMKTFCICFQGVSEVIEINRIKIGGIRNIKEVDVETNTITSLLSINSYGKSNYLNGIIFGIDFIHAPTNIKEIMMDYDPYKPYNTKILFNNFLFEIELNIEESQVIYGYTFKWKKEEKDSPKILSEYLKIKEKKSQKYVTYIKRENGKTVYKSSPTGACTKKINIEDNELVINKIMAYDDLYYLDLVKKINNVSVYVDRHFNTNTEYNVQTRLRKGFSEYDLEDNTNVPRILHKIKTDYPDKFELIVNTLRDIFPFIQDIKIMEYKMKPEKLSKSIELGNYIIADSVYSLATVDKNISKIIDFSDMSDGVRRVLLIFTTLVLADINHYSLIAIEEPENSLNPKILQRYLMSLKDFSKNTKIIITSHSPYLVNYMEPKNIYLGLPNNDGLAMFSRIKEKCVNKLLTDSNNMDMLVGDYLFDLMSGNEEDLEIMTKYVE